MMLTNVVEIKLIFTNDYGNSTSQSIAPMVLNAIMYILNSNYIILIFISIIH